jgi:RNA-directed DNA polymerase
VRDRLEEFSLSFHPEKTRLIRFGRFVADRREQRGLDKPETFDNSTPSRAKLGGCLVE